jgi:hypothetical protein
MPNLIERLLGKRNLQLPSWRQKSWDAQHMEDSLEEMLTYAEDNARAALDWYWGRKRWKAITSQICRLGAILFTAAAAMIPIIGSTGWFAPKGVDQTLWTLKLNQAGYLALGFAALALALDRFMSGSTSWMRYVSTATSIQTALEQFRFDWDKLKVPLAGKTPTPQEAIPLINRIEEFNATVRGLVEGETKAWVADFQQNLTELEKSTAAAVETARANVQAAQKTADDERKAKQQKSEEEQNVREKRAEEERKAVQQKAEEERKAALPGGIDLTVENAGDTDEGYDVLIDSKSKKTGVVSTTCAVVDIAPGIHEVVVQAKIEGIQASASGAVTVASGSLTKVQFNLAKRKAAGR